MSQSHLPNMQTSPGQIPPHLNPLQSPAPIPARTTPRPNLIPPQTTPGAQVPPTQGQTPFQMPSNMSGVGGGMPNGQPMVGATHMDQLQWIMPPPVDQIKFQTAYRTFCSQKAIQHDKRLMEIDHRPVDLYRLHYEVMREGGRDQV